MWSRQTERKKPQNPKPVNATHADCERALRTWTKRQRAEKVVRRALPTEADELQVRAAQLQTLFTA
jgi:hypothetical protein